MRLCFCGVILWTQSRFRRVLRRFRSPRQKSARFAWFCCGWCVARVCTCLCTFVARVAFLILCPPRNAMSRDSAEYSDSFASHNAINRDSAVYSDSFASPQRNEPRVFLGVFVLFVVVWLLEIDRAALERISSRTRIRSPLPDPRYGTPSTRLDPSRPRYPMRTFPALRTEKVCRS